jgi:hypothetical protein
MQRNILGQRFPVKGDTNEKGAESINGWVHSWFRKATPSSGPLPAPTQKLLKMVGCTRTGDNCAYGYRIERHGGGWWSCRPCWDKKQG